MSSEILKITNTAKKYTSNLNCGSVSMEYGDSNYIVYGTYKLSSDMNLIDDFVEYAKQYPRPELSRYGKILSEYEINSQNFIQHWMEFGNIDPYGFAEIQDRYMIYKFYYPTCALLKESNYDVDSKSLPMKSCVFSQAIQYGASNVIDLFNEAIHRMNYKKLSKANNKKFDYDLIENIYGFLIDECDAVYESDNGNYRSPKGWINGNLPIILGLKNRLINEQFDLLLMLK